MDKIDKVKAHGFDGIIRCRHTTYPSGCLRTTIVKTFMDADLMPRGPFNPRVSRTRYKDGEYFPVEGRWVKK